MLTDRHWQLVLLAYDYIVSCGFNFVSTIDIRRNRMEQEAGELLECGIFSEVWDGEFFLGYTIDNWVANGVEWSVDIDDFNNYIMEN